MSLDKKIVCIVEDKPDLREAMNMMIQLTGAYILGGSYANAEEAIVYIDKVRKIASTEIVPWLPVGKYSFGMITTPNLEMLKRSKDVMEYRKFLQRSFPGKFD